MSDESGRWGPYRKLNRQQNKTGVLRMLAQACEAAKANGFDLMPEISPETLDAIDVLERCLKSEAEKLAAEKGK